MIDFMSQCCFCGKGQKEVFFLIIGPQVSICDDCVEMCVNIIAEKKDTTYECDTRQ